MKRVVRVLVVTLFVLAVGVVPALAHCGKRECASRIYVAQNMAHEDLVYELKGSETPPDVSALEGVVKTLEQANNAERLDQLIHDLMLEQESKGSRTKPSKAN